MGISEHNHSNAGMSSKQNYYNGIADAELAPVGGQFCGALRRRLEWHHIAGGACASFTGTIARMGWENNLYDEYVQPTDFHSLWECDQQ
jgi:hypothetical protein